MTSPLPFSAPSELRPYQRDAVEAVLAARRAGKRRLLVHLPTGAGKTVIFSHLARLARRQVLVLAHREELLRSEEHTSELQSPCNLVFRLLLEKKKNKNDTCSSLTAHK